MRIGVFIKENVRMIFAIKFKKCLADTYIFCIIKCKFRYRWKSYVIILLLIDEGSKVFLHYTILPLSLAVYLQIKGNEELLLDVKKVT